MKREETKVPTEKEFPGRLRQIVEEFGSRYALAKASGIPDSTLQGYAAGSKPGMDSLVRLARTANVDLQWLLTGEGKIRPAGTASGAAFADIVMVDQHDPKASLNIPTIVNFIPFSRHFLEKTLGIKEPSDQTLLVIEAQGNFFGISKGDLVLIDRQQADLAQDGVYLLNLPGFAMRGIVRGHGGKVRVMGPANDSSDHSNSVAKEISACFDVRREELLGDGRRVASKIVGRAVWVGRAIN